MRAENVTRLWFETAGKNSDPSLALLHGFTGTHHTWDEVRGRLGKGRFLIVPDLPGHGKSVGFRTVEEMSFDATSDTLVKVLDLAGVERTALLGYSLGGRIALNFALRHQNRLTCLILESTSPGIRDHKERQGRRKEDDALADGIVRYGLKWFVKHWEDTPIFATQKNLNSRVIQRVRNDRLSNTPTGLAMSLRSTGAGRMRPLWDSLGSLEIPVQLIVGRRDEKYLAISEEMKELIPHCTLNVVEGVGHATHTENPVAFWRIVESFLSLED